MKRSRLLIPALVGALGLLGPSLAHAQDPVPQPSADGANAVGACLDADQVWLVVVDDQDNVIANQCVGTPATGQEALEAADVEITTDPGGMICALGGHPDPCPETFTGQYWGSYHAVAGGQWEYHVVGASESSPEPGSIEGWCYNSADEESCTPPLLAVQIAGELVLGEGVTEADVVELEVTAPEVEAPTPEVEDTTSPDATQEPTTESTTEATTGPAPEATDNATDDAAEEGADDADASATPWIIGGAVVVVAAVAAVVVARRRRTDGDVTGGR